MEATRRDFVSHCVAALATALAASGPRVVLAASGGVPLAVVVAKGSSLNALSARDLKRLFLGENVERGDGKKLIPISQTALTPERVGFDRAALGMSADEVARYWIDRKIRGQSGPPKSIGSTELLRRLVAQLDGAVGYLRVSEARDDVKAIRIEGKLPQDPGYPLTF